VFQNSIALGEWSKAICFQEACFSRCAIGPKSGQWDTDVGVQESKFWSKLSKSYAGTLKCYSRVPDHRKIRRLVLPIALLAVVMGMTLGEVWHHHANSPADTCPICHLSHQAIEPPPVSARGCVLVLTRAGAEAERYSAASTPAERHIPARAPPA